MLNKRTIIGVVSTGAILLGVGIARSAVTTERIVTDEAFNLAQQTGQPVWETYKRNVWLAWVGSVIAVAGVSGVAASLYAREEEIDEIADRALGLRDRLASTVPALRSISIERQRVLPPPAASVPIPPNSLEPSSHDVSPTRLKKSQATPESSSMLNPESNSESNPEVSLESKPESNPEVSPTIPSQTPSPLHLTSDPLHTPSTTDDRSGSSPLAALDTDEPPSEAEWLNPLELRHHPSARSQTEPDLPTQSREIPDEAQELQELQELEPLFLAEPALDDWGVSSPRAMSLSDETDADVIFPSFPVDDVEAGDGLDEDVHDRYTDEVSPPKATSTPWLSSLVTAPLLCVCGDNQQDAIVVAKTNLLRELIDQRLNRGHKCIVCDPYDEAKTWRGCDRFGQQEDFATIDVAIATIVAEIETRLEAIKTGQADFSPISLICFQPSDWIDRCASAPLLAARTIDAARVAVSLLLIEITPPKQWSAFGHNTLSFPENAFVELELDLSDATLDGDTSPENLNGSNPASSRTSDDDTASPLPIAWLRDPTRSGSATFETIPLPEFNTPLFSAPPIRSRPPLTVPPIHPSSPTSQSLVNNLPPNQAENSYPMADSETEKQLRSQIALFQNLGMTREQIVVAVWDVRNPDSDEYEIASAFYDRLTR